VQLGIPMHYIVVALFIADVMPSAGLRYRSQIGWRVIVHTAIRYPRDFSVLRDLFPHCRRPGCKGRARERTKMNEKEREEGRSRVAEINCLSAVCLESRTRKAPVSTQPVCPSSDSNIVSADRRSLEGPARNYCATLPSSEKRVKIYFILWFFRDTVEGMVANRQMSATYYNYRWLDVHFD